MVTTAEPLGRVLMVGIPGTRLDAGIEATLRELSPGGVILFRRNLDEPATLEELMDGLREVLPPPTLLAIDQEGGRVSRLEPWVGPTPTALELAAAGEGAVRRFARATATGLRALGFNLDFAPVVDLCPPERANGIADRSFGTDPERVARLAGAFLDGLHEAGVAGCLKHFPGLGDTTVDSHERLPTIERDAARLEAEDLLPYRRLGGRAAAVMVGHGDYPALEDRRELPATLSRTIVTGWLRERLGFRRLVVSDDLDMGAVAPRDGRGGAAVEALRAGCDLLLYCGDLDRARRARDAIADASSDAGFAGRLDAAAREVVRAASRWPAPEPDPGAWTAARAELVEASRLA